MRNSAFSTIFVNIDFSSVLNFSSAIFSISSFSISVKPLASGFACYSQAAVLFFLLGFFDEVSISSTSSTLRCGSSADAGVSGPAEVVGAAKGASCAYSSFFFLNSTSTSLRMRSLRFFFFSMIQLRIFHALSQRLSKRSKLGISFNASLILRFLSIFPSSSCHKTSISSRHVTILSYKSLNLIITANAALHKRIPSEPNRRAFGIGIFFSNKPYRQPISLSVISF